MDGEPIGRDTTVRRTEVDGVTVYWSDAATRRAANLSFRTGRADEPFTLTGINHLIEHLAMFGLGRPVYPANAYVDHVRTAFVATARDHELVAHLGALCRQFHALPIERLADEARILKTESVNHAPTLPLQFLWHRYGARGFGTLGIPEVGLMSLTPARLADWSTERFSAGNAVAWYAGSLPEDLHFELPRGPRRPTMPRISIEPLPLPSWLPTQLPGIALGLVTERDSAGAMAMRILTYALEHRLRYELGLSYEVSLGYLPLDADVAQASIYASAQEQDVRKVRDGFMEVVDRMLDEGPTRADLDRDVDGFARSMDDPDRILGELDAAVRNDLVGHPVMGFAEVLDEMRAVEPGQVQDAIRAAVSESILAGPLDDVPAGTSGRTWARYPLVSPRTVDGRHFDTVARRYPWSPRLDQLIVGDDGVSWVNRSGQPNTVLYRDCVGMLAAHGARILYGADGFVVRVVASSWKNGAEAIRAIDAAIPEDRIVWSVTKV